MNLISVSDINGYEITDHPRYNPLRFNLFDITNIAPGISKEQRHHAMIDSGIDRAVSYLLNHATQSYEIGIGLSMGGVVLWKAILMGLKIRQLYCFSSTRLRYESVSPSPETVHLYFGELDPFRPPDEWFDQLKLDRRLLAGKAHDFYMNSSIYEYLPETDK